MTVSFTGPPVPFAGAAGDVVAGACGAAVSSLFAGAAGAVSGCEASRRAKIWAHCRSTAPLSSRYFR